MKWPISILFAAALVVKAVQPMPNGARLEWDPPTQPGWSNRTFSAWRQQPPTTNWTMLGTTVSNWFFVSGPLIPGTMLGVTVNGQSNAVFASSDIGVAAAPPDANFGAGTLRLLPAVPGLSLQSANSPAGPWTTVGLYTNSPIQLAAQMRQMLRTLETNLPPPPR